MIKVVITRFTGVGTPEVVIATSDKNESQLGKPSLRLIRGGLR